jgi:hypothetical protein
MFKPNYFLAKKRMFRLTFLSVLFLFIGIIFASQLKVVKSESENMNLKTIQISENPIFKQTNNRFLTTFVPSPSPTPDETPHYLVGAFYDVENFPTAKLLLNNKDSVSREVRPTLYSLDGQALEIAPVVVEAGSFRMINLSDWASIGGENFRRGSIRLFHTGKDLNIGTQIYLSDETASLSFEERLTELGKFDSRRLEAVWGMPLNQTQARVILSNTSNNSLEVTAKLSRAPNMTGAPQTFLLLPHQTRVLNLRQDFNEGETFANSNVVGLTLEHTGEKSALKAHGQIRHTASGYSNIISFSNPNGGKSNELHRTGLHVGTMGNEQVAPFIILKNFGTTTATVQARVPYTRSNGTNGTVNLNSVNLPAGEIKILNTTAVVERSQQENIKIAGLEIRHNITPGSIIVNAQSVSASRTQVYRVPLADPLAQTSATGGYPWRIEETSKTVSYIKNMTDLEQDYVAYLTWQGGGMYMIGLKKIAPHKTIEIDVKKIRDEQTPDFRGRTIPLNITSGQIQWTLRQTYNTNNPQTDKFALIGRSEQIDTTNHISSSYACQNCCESWAYGYVLPDGYSFEVGETIQFAAYEEGYTCYFGSYSYSITPNQWRSNNTSVATVNSSGLVTIQGIGNAEIETEWEVSNSTLNDPCPPGVPYLIENEEENGEKDTKEKIDTPNLEPGCGGCFTLYYNISPDADVSGKAKVQKIQYQEPGTSNFVDITGTLYVLKGTTVNFKAIPFPNNATFPNGQPTWSGTSGATGTGQTKSVTFNTKSNSTSDYKTVIARVDSPVIVNVIVYELIGALNPQDYFYGRSVDRYGLLETVDLGVLVSPSITDNQAGGFRWLVGAGQETVTNRTGNTGIGEYVAPFSPMNVTLEIEVVQGPSKGQKISYSKTIVEPSGGCVERDISRPLIHCQNYSSAGFYGIIYLLPKDVSFSRLYFREGGGQIMANGFYASENGGQHVPWSTGALVYGCNLVTGYIAYSGDIIYTNRWSGPFSVGQLSVPIAWKYDRIENPATGAIQFATGLHEQEADAVGTAIIEKSGSGAFSRMVSDASSGDGCTISN